MLLLEEEEEEEEVEISFLLIGAEDEVDALDFRVGAENLLRFIPIFGLSSAFFSFTSSPFSASSSSSSFSFFGFSSSIFSISTFNETLFFSLLSLLLTIGGGLWRGGEEEVVVIGPLIG